MLAYSSFALYSHSPSIRRSNTSSSFRIRYGKKPIWRDIYSSISIGSTSISSRELYSEQQIQKSAGISWSGSANTCETISVSSSHSFISSSLCSLECATSESRAHDWQRHVHTFTDIVLTIGYTKLYSERGKNLSYFSNSPNAHSHHHLSFCELNDICRSNLCV